MTTKWIPVHTTENVYEAEIIKGMLIENNINSIIMNKKDSMYHIGEVEICVSVEDSFNAKQLIEKFHNE